VIFLLDMNCSLTTDCKVSFNGKILNNYIRDTINARVGGIGK
jgi:hypothetical protein